MLNRNLMRTNVCRNSVSMSIGSVNEVVDDVVEFGDVVTMNFLGTFVDGVEFESTRDGEPIEFEVGAGKVVKGIENAVFTDIIFLDSLTVSASPDREY